MLITKNHATIALSSLLLSGLTTIIAFSYTMSQTYEASLASAKHPLETVGNDFIFSCGIFAIICLVATIIGFVWYYFSTPIKSRYGIIRATTLTLPALIALLTCWGWMIFYWCTGDGGNATAHYIQGQLRTASLVSGLTFAILLPVVGLGGIVRKGVSRIIKKMTSKRKENCRFFLLFLGILFAFMTVAVMLFTLDTCNSLSRLYPDDVFTWWLDTSAVLHCCASLIAGIELFFGILYIFSRDRRKVPLGSLLLSSSVMKYISVFGCLLNVIYTIYRNDFVDTGVFDLCTLNIVLQCIVPGIVHVIVAVLGKRKQFKRGCEDGTT